MLYLAWSNTMHFIALLRESVFDLVVTHLAAHTEKKNIKKTRYRQTAYKKMKRTVVFSLFLSFVFLCLRFLVFTFPRLPPCVLVILCVSVFPWFLLAVLFSHVPPSYVLVDLALPAILFSFLWEASSVCPLWLPVSAPMRCTCARLSSHSFVLFKYLFIQIFARLSRVLIQAFQQFLVPFAFFCCCCFWIYLPAWIWQFTNPFSRW